VDGISASLDDEGFSIVAQLKDDREMENFVRRTITYLGYLVKNEAVVNTLLDFVATSQDMKNFQSLKEEISNLGGHKCNQDLATVRPAAGDVAPLTEQGYKAVAEAHSDADMEKFIRRTVKDMGYFVTIDGGVQGVAPYHSCQKDMQSMRSLRTEITRAVKLGNSWASCFNASLDGPLNRSHVGAGALAKLDEEGYREVARMRDSAEMEIFARRVVRHMGLQVTDFGRFHGVVPYFSGTKGSQTYAALELEIANTKASPCGWVADANDEEISKSGAPKPTTSEPASTIKLSEEGYTAIAKRHSGLDMEIFIRRLIKRMKLEIVDEGGLSAVTPYHDCEKATQSFEALKQELWDSANILGKWITLGKDFKQGDEIDGVDYEAQLDNTTHIRRTEEQGRRSAVSSAAHLKEYRNAQRKLVGNSRGGQSQHLRRTNHAVPSTDVLGNVKAHGSMRAGSGRLANPKITNRQPQKNSRSRGVAVRPGSVRKQRKAVATGNPEIAQHPGTGRHRKKQVPKNKENLF